MISQFKTYIFILCCFLLLAGCGGGSGGGNDNPNPNPNTELSDKFLFFADDGIIGRELWMSDGTPEGTNPLKDIRPGDSTTHSSETSLLPNSRSSHEPFLYFNGLAYFSARNDAIHVQPWVSDGTLNGTKMLVNASLNAITDANSESFTVYNQQVYFLAGSGSNAGLWQVQGDRVELVENINLCSLDKELTVFKGALYFCANRAPYGNELWTSKGAGSSAELVANINKMSINNYGSDPSDFTVVGDTLFFTAIGGDTGREVWFSEGVPSGNTQKVSGIDTAPNTDPLYLTAFNGKVYFQATESANDAELWSADVSGATLVQDLYPGTGGGVTNLMVFNNRLYFSGADDVNGLEPRYIDGSVGSTVKLVANIRPGFWGSSPHSYTVFNNALYFIANDGTGHELWKSDGEENGTTELVKNINSTATNGALDYLHVFNGSLYFAADDGSQGAELWKSDGSTAIDGITAIVKDIYDTGNGIK